MPDEEGVAVVIRTVTDTVVFVGCSTLIGLGIATLIISICLLTEHP